MRHLKSLCLLFLLSLLSVVAAPAQVETVTARASGIT